MVELIFAIAVFTGLHVLPSTPLRARLLDARWQEIETRTSNIPFLAIVQGRNRPVAQELPPLMLAVAVGIWVLILMLHLRLFGMSAVWL